ncbi:MAG TPA: serine/threonine-protein kinase [Pyrinomonadaceae bacterium]
MDSISNCEHDGEPTKSTLPINVIINDRYRLIKRLGQRSVSAVYLARDQSQQTNCAIKIILPELMGNDQALAKRFLIEATATANIPHPNIVSITDSGLVDGHLPFLVMELVSGTTLHTELAGSGAITPLRAHNYMLPICSGLAIAHRRDIVHGDLKPRSILLGTDPRVIKVSDFGMSSLKSGTLDGPHAEAKASGMLRSPVYLAPEDWSEERTDSRSDIYSLGVILYQMLAGRVPFNGKSSAAIMKQHLMTTPPPIAGTNGISKELEEVVFHALAKDPDDRPPTVEEFMNELQFVLNDAGVATIVQPNNKFVANEVVLAAASDPPFSGEMTLVNSHAEMLAELPVVELDSTIVLTKKELESARAEVFKTSTLPVEDSDVSINSMSVDHTVRDEGTAPTTTTENYDVNDEEIDEVILPPSRTLAPILLAVGVLLVVVLIGIGVYYSRVGE